MSTTASPVNIPQVKMDKLAAKAEKERIKAEKLAEKEAAKAEKERIKAEKLAEKEAAKAEKERVKEEKEAAKAEKEAAKAEKDRVKAEKEAAKAVKERVKVEKVAAKAEKERAKADSMTNMVQTLPAKERDLTTLSVKGDYDKDFSQTISHSFLDIMRGFDISNHSIDKKFHKFAALIFYIRFLLINSNTSFDIQAFDYICNPFSFDFISFMDFIPYFIQSTLIQYSQYSIDCKLHIIQGNKFLIDKTNIVYDFESHEPIGEYDPKKKEVIYEKAD